MTHLSALENPQHSVPDSRVMFTHWPSLFSTSCELRLLL